MNVDVNTQPHFRTVIRYRVAELVRQYCSIASEKVFVSRPNKAWLSETPCSLVYFTNEEFDDKERNPRIYTRSMDVNVKFLATFDKESDPDTWMDSRCFEFETALARHRFLDLPFVKNTTIRRENPTTISSDEGADQDVESLNILVVVEYDDDLSQLCLVNEEEFLRMKFDIKIGDNTISQTTNVREA